MNSSATTLCSSTPEEVFVDTAEMCSLGRESAYNGPLPSSSSPSPPPEVEHVNLLPGRPADLRITTRGPVVFLAHSAILAFASDKLAHVVGSHLNFGGLTPVHLHESPEAVRAVLEWVYPHTSMRIEDFDTLEVALNISNKYDLDAMHSVLRDLLLTVFLHKDPIRVYSLATTHGFTALAREAARLSLGKVDFRREGMLEELKAGGVSVECAFRLVQYQFAWESALADVLLRTCSVGGEMLLTEEESGLLVCGECASRALGWEDAEGPLEVVGWQRLWAERVYLRLICTPFEECDDLFCPDYLSRVWDEGCEQCMVRLMRSQDALDDWLSRVRRVLSKRWTDIYG
ncbi:hypothetical protein FRC09_007705 [Ceratobasidium sp. 395]|nr:hypothetical protein FRC09_007705 [Ceratobasidium sp. 395]